MRTIALFFIFCQNYSSYLSVHFQLADTIYQNINSGTAAWLYSLQIFLQIDSGDLMPRAAELYYLMVGEKIIGLMMFSIFVVSYTRKVIK